MYLFVDNLDRLGFKEPATSCTHLLPNMKSLSRIAQAYIWSVLLVGAVVGIWQLRQITIQHSWILLLCCGLAALLQTFKTVGVTARTNYHSTLIVVGFVLISRLRLETGSWSEDQLFAELRHAPLYEKHPPERLIPFAKVDDAFVAVRLSTDVCIPPTNVEVDCAVD